MEEEKKGKHKPFIILGAFIALLAIGLVFYFILKKPQDNKQENTITNNTIAPPTNDKDVIKEEKEPILMPVADSSIGEITITAQKDTNSGIEIDSTFLVKTKSSTTKENLAKNLLFKTGEEFSIENIDNSNKNEFILKVGKELNENQIYNIIYNEENKKPLSFAFQTESGFIVTKTYPSDISHDIPVDTGIEITFNNDIYDNVNDYFSIQPHVNGSFEKLEKTIIFKPNEPLDFNTRYIVELKKGLPSKNNKILNEKFNFSFYTEWSEGQKEQVSFYRNRLETFLPEDDVILDLFVSKSMADNDYTVDIYDLKTTENFINYISTEKFNLPNQDFLIETIETKLISAKDDLNYYDLYHFLLGKPLDVGYYLVNIKTNHNEIILQDYKLIQVSNLSVYSFSDFGKTNFWINDTITKESASNAKIEMANMTAITDKDGRANIDYSSNEKSLVKISYSNYPTFVYLNYNDEKSETPINGKYYYYIYTDRSTYKPEDTINVFGVIKERLPVYKLKSSDKITLKLADILEVPITLDAYGSFNVNIPVKDFYGALNLTLYINDETIENRVINFGNYEKDKYLIEVKPDKATYFIGETLKTTLYVTTYDGSPVEGVSFVRDFYGDKNSVKTDKNGVAIDNYTIKNNSSYYTSWQPYYDNLNYYATSNDDYMQYIYLPILQLRSKTMLQTEKQENGDIKFESNYIDIDKINKSIENSEDSYSLEPKDYKGDKIDIDFTIDIHKVTYNTTVTGQKYDYINKIMVSTYDYDEIDSIYHTINSRTNNGMVTISDLPIATNLYERYYAEINYTDISGNLIKFSLYYDDSYYNWNSNFNDNYYEFKMTKDKKASYYQKLKIDETQKIILTNSLNLDYDAVTNGKVFAIVYSDDILKTEIVDPSGFDFTFLEKYIDHVFISGAYFDGKYVYKIKSPLSVYFDTDDKKLDLDITYSKDEYKPGDEVTATIKVTDKSGKPKKSMVNISVVDEAAFSQNPNYSYFLDGFFSGYYFYSYPFIYTSFDKSNETLTSNNMDGGAEQGGGEGEMILRKDFKDNPAFLSKETDNNGILKVSYKLSDNITSWRLTAHAISKDNYISDSKSNVISTLPFYIDLVMTDRFLVGDEVNILVKPLGQEYKFNETTVNYKLEILKDKEVIFTDSSSSKTFKEFNAGKLNEGEYLVKLVADVGSFKDGIEESFSITKNAITLPLKNTQILSKDNKNLLKIGVDSSPIKLTMSNYDIRFIMDVLYSCMNYNSKRTDYLAANYYIDYFLDSKENNLTDLFYTRKIKNGISYYYGISELDSSETDLYYTSRFVSAFHEVFEENDLTNFVSTNMKDLENFTSEDIPDIETKKSANYLIMAGINKKVLLDIYEQIKIIENDTNQEKFKNNFDEYLRILNYIKALCLFGDDVKASELLEKYPFNNSMLDNITDKNEKDLKLETINTSIFYINTTINPQKAYEYLQNKKENIFLSDVLEKINFVKKVVPVAGLNSEISYNLNGKNQNKTLANFDVETLSISKEQFDNLNLEQISGSTDVIILYNGAPDTLNSDFKNIEIEKKVLSQKEYLVSNDNTDIYYIVINVVMPENAEKGFYKIRDRVPSNSRFLNNKNNYDKNFFYFVNNFERQFVDIDFYYDAKSKELTFDYPILKINNSESLLGKAYIIKSNYSDKIWGETK